MQVGRGGNRKVSLSHTQCRLGGRQTRTTQTAGTVRAAMDLVCARRPAGFGRHAPDGPRLPQRSPVHTAPPAPEAQAGLCVDTAPSSLRPALLEGAGAASRV